MVTKNGIEATNSVMCKKCRNIYIFETSTLHLVKHKCYIMVNTRTRSIPVIDLPSETIKKRTKLAMEWIIQNGRPFNLIADSGIFH